MIQEAQIVSVPGEAMTSEQLATPGVVPTIDPALAERVLAAIDEAETVAFLQALIRCPTVNPPGDVREAAAVCAAKLREAGFATQVVGPDPEHQNVVATLKGTGNGPRLAFNAHYDVVPIGEESAWRYPPFGGEVHDGRVYGRGAGDDKASVTAQVMAGVALARSGVPLAGTLIVTEVADEETAGHLGAGYIVKNGYVEADYVIVGEQTRGQMCIGERGAVAVGLTVYGATGHAATPWMGANAIEGMAQVLTALQSELWPRLAARTHPVLAASTATISLIDGGVKTNVIPDRCEIHIDRRILPEETPASVLAEIREVAETALAGQPRFRVDVFEKMNRPAQLASEEWPVSQALLAAIRFIGKEPVVTGFFAGTDAKHFTPHGFPTIVMGPGDPATAHTTDEWVGVDEVMEATRLYALTALALLGEDAPR
jgi:acetylornithine deacetylase/succinyl-diaminopimelate desuccinylase family protein